MRPAKSVSDLRELFAYAEELQRANSSVPKEGSGHGPRSPRFPQGDSPSAQTFSGLAAAELLDQVTGISRAARSKSSSELTVLLQQAQSAEQQQAEQVCEAALAPVRSSSSFFAERSISFRDPQDPAIPSQGSIGHGPAPTPAVPIPTTGRHSSDAAADSQAAQPGAIGLNSSSDDHSSAPASQQQRLDSARSQRQRGSSGAPDGFSLDDEAAGVSSSGGARPSPFASNGVAFTETSSLPVPGLDLRRVSSKPTLAKQQSGFVKLPSYHSLRTVSPYSLAFLTSSSGGSPVAPWRSVAEQMADCHLSKRLQRKVRRAAIILHRLHASRGGRQPIMDQSALQSAQGLIFMRMRKVGLGAGWTWGTGFIIRRLHTTDEGDIVWSAPSFCKVKSFSVGLTCGWQEVDTCSLLNSLKAVSRFTQSGRLFGTDVACAFDMDPLTMDIPLNPIREHAVANTRNVYDAPVTYSVADGAIVDLSVKFGAVLVDDEANHRLYGRTATAHGILNGIYAPPPEFGPLYDCVQRLTDEDLDPTPVPTLYQLRRLSNTINLARQSYTQTLQAYSEGNSFPSGTRAPPRHAEPDNWPRLQSSPSMHSLHSLQPMESSRVAEERSQHGGARLSRSITAPVRGPGGGRVNALDMLLPPTGGEKKSAGFGTMFPTDDAGGSGLLFPLDAGGGSGLPFPPPDKTSSLPHASSFQRSGTSISSGSQREVKLFPD